MSQKTGRMRFQYSEWVVAGKVNGVVITSPLLIRSASRATNSAIVPLQNRLRCSTPRKLRSLCFQLFVQRPLIGELFPLPNARQHLNIAFKLGMVGRVT